MARRLPSYGHLVSVVSARPAVAALIVERALLMGVDPATALTQSVFESGLVAGIVNPASDAQGLFQLVPVARRFLLNTLHVRPWPRGDIWGEIVAGLTFQKHLMRRCPSGTGPWMHALNEYPARPMTGVSPPDWAQSRSDVADRLRRLWG